MNDIIKPLTKDGLVGWDRFGQLMLWRLRANGAREGRIIADVRGKTCPVCLRGWEETSESLGDQHHWDARAEWAHESCVIRYGALKEFDFWVCALVEAKFIFGREDNPRMVGESPALEALPNQYWGQEDPWGAGRPWYRARLLKRLPDGGRAAHGRTLKLGSRKRVFHMEVEPGDGPYDAATAERLFAAENVTKKVEAGGMMVHAWGKEKAQEYLHRFAEVLGVQAANS